MKRLMIIGLLLCSEAAADELPKSMRGLWAFEAGDCTSPQSDGLLRIGAKTAEFYASSWDLKRIVTRNGSVIATGFVANEGEPGRTREKLTLKLLTVDRLRVDDHVYHRCKGSRAG